MTTIRIAETFKVRKRTILQKINILKDKYVRYNRNVGYWEIINPNSEKK